MDTAQIVRCKDCDEVVKIGLMHHCVKTNKEVLVKMGPDCPDRFYLDKNKGDIA